MPSVRPMQPGDPGQHELEMMAALLAKPTTQREKIRFALQMNAFLWQIGVTAPEEGG